jgi:hypothetical protein
MSAGPPQAHRGPHGGRLRSSRGRNQFPPGMKTPRTAHLGFAGAGHVCEAAVRRRLRRLQGFDAAA